MPRYDLQHTTATGTATKCGSVVISNAGGSISINFVRCHGANVNATGVSIGTAAYSPAGGGTALNPNAGDTLTLGGFQASGDDGNIYTFSLVATYRQPGNGSAGGYFTSPGIAGALDDWDAADTTGPEPKGNY